MTSPDALPELVIRCLNGYNGFDHAASARKHRKQGHHVMYVAATRCYAWRKP